MIALNELFEKTRFLECPEISIANYNKNKEGYYSTLVGYKDEERHADKNFQEWLKSMDLVVIEINECCAEDGYGDFDHYIQICCKKREESESGDPK